MALQATMQYKDQLRELRRRTSISSSWYPLLSSTRELNGPHNSARHYLGRYARDLVAEGNATPRF